MLFTRKQKMLELSEVRSCLGVADGVSFDIFYSSFLLLICCLFNSAMQK